jgi:hypothetical protein
MSVTPAAAAIPAVKAPTLVKSIKSAVSPVFRHVNPADPPWNNSFVALP